MRNAWISTVIALGIVGYVISSAQASHWNWKEPGQCINYINRCLGFGWSDGYHATGSRNSWTPLRPVTTTRSSAIPLPVSSWPETMPTTYPHQVQPSPRQELPAPQAQLRRLPPITRQAVRTRTD